MCGERLCVVCNKHVHRDGHHLTGCGPDGDKDYLDPELKADLCHDDHELVHDDLRRQRIDKPLPSTNVLERIERCLRRVAIFLARVGEATGIVWVVLLAGACARWAVELHVEIVRLDGWNPGWRAA